MFQGDVPWDNKEFRMFILTGLAFWATIAYYFFLRDGGHEVSWKDFVNNYLSKGVVSASLESYKEHICSKHLRMSVFCSSVLVNLN